MAPAGLRLSWTVALGIAEPDGEPPHPRRSRAGVAASVSAGVAAATEARRRAAEDVPASPDAATAAAGAKQGDGREGQPPLNIHVLRIFSPRGRFAHSRTEASARP